MAFGNGIFNRLKKGLSKTQQSLMGRIDAVIGSAEEIDDDLYDELEETLILADVGALTANKLKQLRTVNYDVPHDVKVNKLDLILTVSSKNDLLPGPVEELPQLYQTSKQRFAFTSHPTQHYQPVDKPLVLHPQGFSEYLFLALPYVSV